MRAMFDMNGGLSFPERDDDVVVKRYRAIFISDLHLGTPGCQATALLDFMRSYPSDYLYLVGDIVDGWQLRRRWYLHDEVDAWDMLPNGQYVRVIPENRRLAHGAQAALVGRYSERNNSEKARE